MPEKPKLASKAAAISRKHAAERGALIPVLQELQEEEGYLKPESLAEVSEQLKIPLSSIYGVATFYAQFRLEQPGKNIIQICSGTACHVKGSKKVLEEFEKELGIKAGETTQDKKFTLLSVSGVAAYELEPITKVNDDIYSSVAAGQAKGIIAKYGDKK